MQHIIAIAIFLCCQLSAMNEQQQRVFKVGVDVGHDASALRKFSKQHHRKLVIVVDDNDFMRRMASRLVQRVDGHVVVEFTSGDQLLEALKIKKLRRRLIASCRLIILDKEMPGKDGIEVMQTLSRRGLLEFAQGKRTVPVVLNTSDDVTNLGAGIRDQFAKILKQKNSAVEIQEMLAIVSPKSSLGISAYIEKRAIKSKSCGVPIQRDCNKSHPQSSPSSPLVLKKYEMN